MGARAHEGQPPCRAARRHSDRPRHGGACGPLRRVRALPRGTGLRGVHRRSHRPRQERGQRRRAWLPARRRQGDAHRGRPRTAQDRHRPLLPPNPLHHVRPFHGKLRHARLPGAPRRGRGGGRHLRHGPTAPRLVEGGQRAGALPREDEGRRLPQQASDGMGVGAFASRSRTRARRTTGSAPIRLSWTPTSPTSCAAPCSPSAATPRSTDLTGEVVSPSCAAKGAEGIAGAVRRRRRCPVGAWARGARGGRPVAPRRCAGWRGEAVRGHAPRNPQRNRGGLRVYTEVVGWIEEHACQSTS